MGRLREFCLGLDAGYYERCSIHTSVPNSTSALTFGRSGRGRGVLEIGLDRPSLPLKPSGPTDLPN